MRKRSWEMTTSVFFLLVALALFAADIPVVFPILGVIAGVGFIAYELSRRERSDQ